MLPLLEISGLTVSFKQEEGAPEALKEISFAIMRSETVALVGESGSGKSVTALSLLQLLPSLAEIKGKAIFRPDKQPETELIGADSPSIRSLRGNRISMIFQEPMTSLNPVMRCGNQIMEGLRTHKKISAKEARPLAIQAMQWAGLTDPDLIWSRYPHQLSGGQKQRVMIAMAMACRPELLIADEPTTALDLRTQKEIMDSLLTLRKEFNMSMLFITHDLDLAADIADKVIVMHRGEIVETGTPRQIFEKPAHPYTRELIEAAALLKEKNNLTVPLQEMGMDAKPLLEVKELSVKYKSGKQYIHAVDHVSFRIFPGEIIGLAGESGCGKTTLGRTIMRLQSPQSGEILLNGENILEKSGKKSLAKEMQIVFQDPYGSLNPLLTAGRAIREVLKVHDKSIRDNETREKTRTLLNNVNLEERHASRFPHEFSGGQRQRICIARALATNPGFMVFDESVSALDVSTQANILQLIRQLRDDLGITALFISHDLAALRSLCDRILIMKSGKIIESGKTEEIFENPAEPYTRQLVSALPRTGRPEKGN